MFQSTVISLLKGLFLPLCLLKKAQPLVQAVLEARAEQSHGKGHKSKVMCCQII